MKKLLCLALVGLMLAGCSGVLGVNASPIQKCQLLFVSFFGFESDRVVMPPVFSFSRATEDKCPESNKNVCLSFLAYDITANVWKRPVESGSPNLPNILGPAVWVLPVGIGARNYPSGNAGTIDNKHLVGVAGIDYCFPTLVDLCSRRESFPSVCPCFCNRERTITINETRKPSPISISHRNISLCLL